MQLQSNLPSVLNSHAESMFERERGRAGCLACYLICVCVREHACRACAWPLDLLICCFRLQVVPELPVSLLRWSIRHIHYMQAQSVTHALHAVTMCSESYPDRSLQCDVKGPQIRYGSRMPSDIWVSDS